MANLNSLQALQSRDNLIFANQPALDSSQSHSDQGLTSFPNELRAAKQQSQNATPDTPRTEARSTQAPEEKPQNLPPSTDQTQQDAANIAAPQTKSSSDSSQANAQANPQTPSDTPPVQGVDQATLGQVEVALAVEAKATTATDTLTVVDAALSAALLDGVTQQAGDKVVTNAALNTQTQAALAKAAADTAAQKVATDAAATAVTDVPVAVVDPSISTAATEVATLTDSLQSKDSKKDVVANDVQVAANPIAIANVESPTGPPLKR